MTTGQPIRFPSDRNKYNNEYMETLQLQINLNQSNLEANRLYHQTGQLPASTQLIDTRSNEEKLADVHSLKQSIISDLAPIAEPMFASAVIQGVIDSPLNVNNSLFKYLAQNASMFAQTLSKKYKFGIAGDANDVAIMVQFLEDAYNKTKNSFQSIKGYINSNTNDGNKTFSSILSANDTDNIKNELKDLTKRLTYFSNAIRNLPTLREALRILLSNTNTIDRFLPTSAQMQKILSDISEREYRGVVPNPDERALIMGVLDVLRKLPKLSSVQTLADRLERALIEADIRSAVDCINGIRTLFGYIVFDNNTVALMQRFENEYIVRAQRELNEANRINQIQATQEITAENARDKLERKAQRVYVINPANDAVNVQGNMGMGNPGSYIDFEGDGDTVSDITQPISIAGSQQSGLSGYQSVGSVGSHRSGDSIPSLLSGMQSVGPQVPAQAYSRNDYIDQNVNLLTADGVRELATRMEQSRRISRLDRDGLADMLGNLRQIPLDDQKEFIISILQKLSDMNYNPSRDPPINFFGVGGPPGVSGLGLGKKVKKGRGLYSPFGDSEINHKNLENNILTLRRKSKTNYMDLPSKHISKHMKNIIHNIVGGKIANFEDINNLNDEERNYLSKVVKKSNLQDRLSVPAPSKDQADKDNHQWEVMRGEIMAGNDSHELVKKFKILTLKLTRQGLLPKNEVMDLFEDLVSLGY